MRLDRALLSTVALLGLAVTLSAQVVPTTRRVPVPRTIAPRTGEANAPAPPARGPVRVAVRLMDAPVLAAAGPNSVITGGVLTPAQRTAYAANLRAKQQALTAQIQAAGGRVVASLTNVANVIIVEIDATRARELAALPGVTGVRTVPNYQKALSETVPYVGATAAQLAGLTGAGVRVAVLDSGIDYTHRNLGGPGTAAAFLAAYGTSPASIENKVVTPSTGFPTAKVPQGFDFVGEVWPNGPRGFSDADLAPDPNPIDAQGHGTHVADIIGGFTPSPPHAGVAPGSLLHAVKVCSAVSSSCNGTAILQGMEYATGRNPVTGAAVTTARVINLSLGTDFGQQEDDVTEATNIAARAGFIVVVAAGNAADRPYIVGSPAVGPEVISVAQTEVPSAYNVPLVVNRPASIAGTYRNTALLEWAPITATSFISGDVVYVGRGCNADPYLASPAGKVALIDRGVCNISEKVQRAALAGATGVLIGLVADGDAVSFSKGPETTFVPSLVITKATADLIKARLALNEVVNVTASLAVTTPLAGSVVSTSSRGPSISQVAIKPDISAPGGSVSAVAGTGTGEAPFGGTSGATPVVAGAAALLVQAYPSRTPLEIKALLMNSAETNIFTNPATRPDALAPVTRIGAGEVRVNSARLLTTAAWDATVGVPSLSFGFYAAARTRTFTKTVLVRNYGNSARTYSISSADRTNAASSAVTVSVPGSITVPANGSATFTVSLTVNAPSLPQWPFGVGQGETGSGLLLESVEFDGFITLTDGTDRVRLPWYVLPRRSAAVRPARSVISLNGATSTTLTLNNPSPAQAGPVSVFSLVGTSPRLEGGAEAFPLPGEYFATVDLRQVGVRALPVSGGLTAMQFAINTYGERAYPVYPGGFEVDIDVDRDGSLDFFVYNTENGAFGSSGQFITWVQNARTGARVARFFVQADFNSANMVMTALASDLGVNPDQPFDFFVLAYDSFFTGLVTDTIPAENPDFTITPITHTLNAPVYTTGAPNIVVPAGGSTTLTITRNAAEAALSPNVSGLLLQYRYAEPRAESDRILITP